MSIDISFTTGTKLVKVESLTTLLTNFRQQLEHESGSTVNRIDTNAAELLSDLCRFLGLSDQNRRRVLGTHGTLHVNRVEHTSTVVTIRH